MQSKGIPPLPADIAHRLAPSHNQQHQVTPSREAEAAAGQRVRLWQLYVPAVPALYDEADGAADEGGLDVEVAGAGGPGRGDDVGVLGAGPDGSDDDVDDDEYDDEEEELQEVDMDTEEDNMDIGEVDMELGSEEGEEELEEVVTSTVGTAAMMQLQASDNLPVVVPITAAAAAAAPMTTHAAMAQQLAAGLSEPVIVPVRQIPCSGTGSSKIPIIISVYVAAQAAVAGYLAYAKSVEAANSNSTGAQEQQMAVGCSVAGSAGAAESNSKLLTVTGADAAAAPVELVVGNEAGGPAAQVQTDAAVVEQPVNSSSLATPAGAGRVSDNMVSCGPEHLVQAAQAAFFKLLDGRTVTQEEAHRVLPAAGGTAAALAQAAGLSYGCREHVAFIKQLLAGMISGWLGTVSITSLLVCNL